MPKSRFGPRTAALYVGGVPTTGKGLQGPHPCSCCPAIAPSVTWSLRSLPLHSPKLQGSGKDGVPAQSSPAQPEAAVPQDRGLHWGCVCLAHTATQHLPPGMGSPLLPRTD